MARPDQALSFHHVGGFRYELSGLRTGSVRDQILRAQLLVERLLARNDLSDDPLLVIGGGAAGVTAALTASRLGRDVTL
jgi:heterodisulfide reductase subunit A-like polyferredoxin